MRQMILLGYKVPFVDGGSTRKLRDNVSGRRRCYCDTCHHLSALDAKANMYGRATRESVIPKMNRASFNDAEAFFHSRWRLHEGNDRYARARGHSKEHRGNDADHCNQEGYENQAHFPRLSLNG